VVIAFSQVLIFVLGQIAGFNMLNHFTPFRIQMVFYNHFGTIRIIMMKSVVET
jgi:hypothetical protein